MLGVVSPHLMVTDPPYGVNYDPAWRNQAGRSVEAMPLEVGLEPLAWALLARPDPAPSR